MVNQSTQLARDIVQTMLDYGVTDVVLAPGSRSAPLALAFAQAEQAGNLRLHVRIDERDAGFLALGLAKGSGRLVPIVVTSGTAVANLFPAVVEAYHSAVPIVVFSADRPAASRGRSAPQIIDQAHLFGHFSKVSLDLEPDVQNVEGIREAIEQTLTTHRGPAHINVQFDMPLVPDPADLPWQPSQVSLKQVTESAHETADLTLPARGIIVAGDLQSESDSDAVKSIAHQLGWPIISEPTANVHDDSHALAHGVLLLSSGKLPTPEAVLTFGTVGLSRPVLQLLREADTYIAVHCDGQGPDVPDPVQSVQRIIQGIPTVSNEPDAKWLDLWLAQDQVAQQIVANEFRHDSLTGPCASVALWNHLPADSRLVVAASWPVRHLEAYAANRPGVRVFGNRGVNGIDGLVSTAWGIAATCPQRTYLLVGDIAFLHDLAGLNVAESESKPNLTVVVLDNDGGGIFSQLEQGDAVYAEYFERIFGTPHGKDLWQLAESLGYASSRVTTQSELRNALESTDKIPGVHVIVALTGSRADEVAQIRAIASKV